MFFYLYDTIVLDKKYSTLLDRIESRIIELGINGRVEKLTALRNMKELIELGIKNDAHTIVVLGSDQTFLRALQVVAQHPNCALGFLPISESTLGKLFGIQDPLDGCDTLSRRITKQLALGKANQTYFLQQVSLQLPAGSVVRCNDQWSVTTQQALTDCLIRHLDMIGEHQLLQIQLTPQPAPAGFLRKIKSFKPTLLPVRKAVFDHPDQAMPAVLDGATTLKTPITVSLKPKAIKVIVGKQRQI